MPRDPIIDAIQAQVSAVDLPDWPVLGLVDSPRAGWLSGVGTGPAGGAAIRLDYGRPGDAQRTIVQSQAATIRAIDPVAVARHLLADDDGEPLPVRSNSGEPASPDGHAIVSVDDRALPPVPRFSVDGVVVLMFRHGGATVVLATAGSAADRVALRTVRDLTHFQAERQAVVRAVLSRRRPPG